MRSFAGKLATVASITIASTLFPPSAGAHDAKSGWTYPLACCSDYDCREVADADVLERPGGYVIRMTGEVIPMTSRKIRHSPDGKVHWCCDPKRPKDCKTICLFMPPRSF